MPSSRRSRALSSLLVALTVACGDDGGGDGSSGDATDTSSTGATGMSGAPTSSTSASGSASTSTDTEADTDPTGATESDDASSGSSGEESSSTGARACELTNEWVVVDDFTGVGSASDAQARGSVVDADGRVYVGGLAGQTWTVRRSEDGGASWETVDEFQLQAGMQSSGGGGVADADGGIWIVGSGTDSDGFVRRVVRHSTDAGATWETVEAWQLEAGYDTYAAGIAVGPDGSVWAVGQAGSPTASHWTVRRSNAEGQAWTTDDDWQLAPGHVCLPRGVEVDEGGIVYVAGVCEDATPAMHWIVRRRDAGGEWSTFDDYQPDEGFHAGAQVAIRNGRVLVTGAATIAGAQHWIVRARVDDGEWSNLDDLGQMGVAAGAAGVYEDGNGTLVVVGTRDPGTPATLTRRSDDDGATWTTIDEWAYEDGIYGGGLTADGEGNLYTVGIGLDVSGANHWIVRRMGCE